MQAPLQAGGVPLPSSHPGAGDVDPPLDQVAALRAALPAALSAALSAFAPSEEALAAWMSALSRQGPLVPSGRRDAWVVRRETLQRVREARQRRAACRD